MEISGFLKGKCVLVSRKNYAIVKAREEMQGAFAVVRDGRELTIVIEQEKVDGKTAIEMERFWRVLTFDFAMPFDLVGFIAEISRALAEEGISVFVVSSYSTDHVLVKEEHVMKAIAKLGKMGLKAKFA